MALMAALAKHIQIMPEVKTILSKKRAEEKKHNQAIAAFRQHATSHLEHAQKQ